MARTECPEWNNSRRTASRPVSSPNYPASRLFRPPSTLVRTYTIPKSVLVKSRKGAQFWNKNHNCRCGQEVASEDRYSQFLLKPTRHIGSVSVQDGLHADIRFSK